MTASATTGRVPWIKLSFGGLLLVFVVVAAADTGEILRSLRSVAWGYAALALSATALSYRLAVEAFVGVNIAFASPVTKRRLRTVGFITIASNNLITLGGTVGHTLRVFLLRGERADPRQILSASLFFSYLNVFAIIVFLPFGLLAIGLDNHIPMRIALPLRSAFPLFLILWGALSAFVFNRTFQRSILTGIGNLVRRVVRRDVREPLLGVGNELSAGAEAMRQRPLRFSGVLLLVFLDWLFCVVALWFCFRAFGLGVPFPLVLAGFFFSVSVGLLSLLPGGLGVQDVSEAVIYSLLGVPFSQAVAVAILFRVVYYLMPFLCGLLFYGWLFVAKKPPVKGLSVD